MFQITEEDIKNFKPEANEIREYIKELCKEQTDIYLNLWLAGGLEVNFERVIGFIMAYQIIKNAIARKECTELEKMIKDGN
jgi:hypothetical protein